MLTGRSVKRAYQELENEGVIVTQQGKGSFVAAIDDLGTRLREEEIDGHLEEAIGIAKTVGMDAEQLATRIAKLFTESGKGRRK